MDLDTAERQEEIAKLNKDITLLEESIRHWTGVVHGMEEPYAQNCSLCREYILKYRSCRNCPIGQATGRAGCEGTPYSEAVQEFEREKQSKEVNFSAKRREMKNWLINLHGKLCVKLGDMKTAVSMHDYQRMINKDLLCKGIPASINWEEVSSEFNYLVVDQDGRAYLSTSEPERCKEFVGWGFTGKIAKAEAFASYRRGNYPWQDSLVRRDKPARLFPPGSWVPVSEC